MKAIFINVIIGIVLIGIAFLLKGFFAHDRVLFEKELQGHKVGFVEKQLPQAPISIKDGNQHKSESLMIQNIESDTQLSADEPGLLHSERKSFDDPNKEENLKKQHLENIELHKLMTEFVKLGGDPGKVIHQRKPPHGTHKPRIELIQSMIDDLKKLEQPEIF